MALFKAHKTLTKSYINVYNTIKTHVSRLYTHVQGLVSPCNMYLKQTNHLFGIIKTEAVIWQNKWKLWISQSS